MLPVGKTKRRTSKMRVIAVGCEYSGVTTLLTALTEWGASRSISFHTDDHFTIPGGGPGGGLDESEQAEMLTLGPGIKERFQRFQLVYHIRLMHEYEHILLGGFHIEEQVYGPKYYYPTLTNWHHKNAASTRKYEREIPQDSILVHVKASPEVIRDRMQRDPHPHGIVPREDVEVVQELFASQFADSWIKHKVEIDTTELRPQDILTAFFRVARVHLTEHDLLRIATEGFPDSRSTMMAHKL